MLEIRDPDGATGLQIDGVNGPAVPIDRLMAAQFCKEYVTLDPANPPATDVHPFRPGNRGVRALQ
jgi:hypothetical protein